MNHDDRKTIAVITALLLVVMTGLVYLAVSVGATWDEPFGMENAEHTLRYFSSYGHDRRLFDHFNMRYYGAFLDVLAKVLAQLTWLQELAARHFLSALAGTGILAYTWVLARMVSQRARAGFAALVFLLMTPSFMGQTLFNLKDVAFALFFIGTITHLLRFHTKPRASDAVLYVVYAALALNDRPAFLAFHVAFLGLLLISTRPRPWRTVFLLALAPLMLAGVAWPLAFERPLFGVVESFLAFSSFKWRIDVLYAGQIYASQAVPWDYLLRWFALVTPLGFSLAFLLFPWVTRRQDRVPWLLFGGVASVIVAFPLLHTPMYDGVRHYLFLFPLAAVVAAHALEQAAAKIGRGEGRSYAVAMVLCLALNADALIFALREPRYQYIFFNTFTQGLRQAVTRYETDYWGLCYQDLLRATNQVLSLKGKKIFFNAALPLARFYQNDFSYVIHPRPEGAELLFVMSRGADAAFVTEQREAPGKVQAIAVEGMDICGVYRQAI